MVITFLLGIILTLIGVARIMAYKGVAIRLIRALEAWHGLRPQVKSTTTAKAQMPAALKDLKLMFKGAGQAERLYTLACANRGPQASTDDLIKEALRIHGQAVKFAA